MASHLRHSYAGWLLLISAISGLYLSSCSAEGKTIMEFDKMYYQALKEVSALPDAYWRPCTPFLDNRDYRYSHCFTENSGSASLTMQRMYRALERAGFKRLSTGSDSSELDAKFVVANSPYSVTLTFGDDGISWTAYHSESDTGFVPPREGLDKDASYALADPVDVGRQMGYELLRSAGVEASRLPSLVQPCGEATQRQANTCAKVNWTPAQAKRALGLRFTDNDVELFKKLDQRKTFEYRDERVLEDLREAGVFKGGEKSATLFRKQSETSYFFQDDAAWPAYTFELHVPAQGQTGQVVIISKRRPAVVYKP